MATNEDTIVNTYCAVSAAFFAACAIAQLNDPDPVLWVAGYVTGGCLLNILCVLYHSVGRYFDDDENENQHKVAADGINKLRMLRGGGSKKSSASKTTRREKRSVRSISRRIMTVFAGGTALIIFRMTAMDLLPKLDLHQPPKELAWSILEFEEGREIAGLLLLALHVWKLRGYLSNAKSAPSTEASSQPKTTSSSFVGTVLMVGIIGGAVYLWVYYQPLMNSRYGTEHCDGAFGTDRGGSEPSSEL